MHASPASRPPWRHLTVPPSTQGADWQARPARHRCSQRRLPGLLQGAVPLNPGSSSGVPRRPPLGSTLPSAQVTSSCAQAPSLLTGDQLPLGHLRGKLGATGQGRHSRQTLTLPIPCRPLQAGPVLGWAGLGWGQMTAATDPQAGPSLPAKPYAELNILTESCKGSVSMPPSSDALCAAPQPANCAHQQA